MSYFITPNYENNSTAFTIKHLPKSNCSSSVYSSNKVLVNKEKLNQQINNQQEPVKVTEKIYYNPKFFMNNAIKTEANAENVKNLDKNIHINRHYFATMSKNTSDNSNLNPRIRGGIHVNPIFFKKPSIKEETPIIKSSVSPTKESNTLKNNYKPVSPTKSKYKYIKTVTSPPKTQNSPKPFCIKTKYSLKRLNVTKSAIKDVNKKEIPNLKITKNSNEFNKTKLVRKMSSEFKNFSRTKLIRKSVLQSVILARRRSRLNSFKKSLQSFTITKKVPLKKKSINITYFPKANSQNIPINYNEINENYKKINNNKCENLYNNSFKSLSKMKIVRKSLLKAQIEARNQVKKQFLRDYKNLKYNVKRYSKFTSRNENLRKKYLLKQNTSLSWRKKKIGTDTSSVRCKKSPQTSKHLKKNNQPCPFYNRFGRCKGKEKGTCPKLHDPLYISVCRKFLQGECNDKGCLLSHDIRPGKMPTCHHYLAGLCTRPNCTYLHIKVNPKAPICTSFLQGFCPDVFNCLKRHEFICPVFAEKGSCPRGKSCTYPHRSPVVHSKLLKDDQKPLIHRPNNSIIDNSFNNSLNFKKVSADMKENILDCNKKLEKTEKPNLKKCKKDYVKETFTRYFDVSNTEFSADNESDIKENIISIKNSDELR